MPHYGTVHIAGVEYDSLVDGPGLRAVLFFAGCKVKCDGCHNRMSWNKDDYAPCSILELVELIKKNAAVPKLTISGGEPLEQIQALQTILTLFEDWDIGLYTSYNMRNIPDTIKKHLSFVKTGCYKKDKAVDGEYYGSSNQELIIL